MKKTIIISSYDDINNPYYAGGGAVAVHQVAKRLIEEYQVLIYTGRYPGSKNLTREGVEYRRIGLDIFGPKIGQLVYQFILPFLVIFIKYDLWIENFTPPFSIAFLPIFTTKPVIGLAHMLSGEDMQRKYKLPFPVIERFGLKFYHRIITPSEIYAQKIRNINLDAEVVSIPNGVEPPVYSSEKNRRKIFLSFIGRIEINQKGLDLLLDAFKRVSDILPCKLQIAGDGEKTETLKLKKIINNHQLNTKVICRGRIEKLSKSKFFSQTMVMVLSSRYETFSMVALETLASGIPYVCFNIDGLKWLPDNCGIKVPAFDADALSRAIFKLLKNPVLRRQYSYNASLASRQYSWDKSAKAYSYYLRKVLPHD